MWCFVRSGSMEELRPVLERMMERYKLFNWPLPKYFSTDRPSMERPILEETMPSLRRPVVTGSSFPEYVVPGESIKLIDGRNLKLTDVHAVLTEFLTAIDSVPANGPVGIDASHVVGCDVEWNMANQQPQTVQISNALGMTVVFHFPGLIKDYLKKARSKIAFPAELDLLQSILSRPDIVKAGSNSKNDQRILQSQFDLEMQNVVNLSTFAIQMQASTKPRQSLADMVSFFLKKTLPKPAAIRTGDWTKPLTQAALQYAAADAAASRDVYAHILTSRSPACDEPLTPTTVHMDQRVYLCDSTGKILLAEGTVVRNPVDANPRLRRGAKPVSTSTAFMGMYSQHVSPTRAVVLIDKVIAESGLIPLPLSLPGSPDVDLQPPLTELDAFKNHVLVPVARLRAHRHYIAPSVELAPADPKPQSDDEVLSTLSQRERAYIAALSDDERKQVLAFVSPLPDV